jgi:hypothetical protein
MDLSDLPALLTAYKQKFEEDLSAKDYQWVNNIAAVKSSSATIVKLEALLLEKFAKKDYMFSPKKPGCLMLDLA